MRKTPFIVAVVLLSLSSAASSSERKIYSYDALGRLIVTESRATGGNGSLSSFEYDRASNRRVARSSGQFKGSSMAPGTELSPGQTLLSDDARFRFVLQFDGNLVLYDQSNVPICYTATTTGAKLIMQLDGNLVVYDAAGNAVWHPMTNGNPGAKLVVQNDGNTVIYAAQGLALWSTQTCCR